MLKAQTGAHLKYHAHVQAMRPPVLKPVKQPDTVSRVCLVVCWQALPHIGQQLDLVPRGLGVMLGALLHLLIGIQARIGGSMCAFV